MARYVLLRIEDNDEAEKLVEAIKAPNGVWFYEQNSDADSITVAEGIEEGAAPHRATYRMRPLDYLKVSILGLFGAPTQFCECVDKSEVSARSKKYGWWVHRKCAKPKPGNMQHPHNLFGRNELGKHKPELYIGVTEPRRK